LTPRPVRKRLTCQPISIKPAYYGGVLLDWTVTRGGGAALSLRAVTGKPDQLVGVGEKPEDFEALSPGTYGFSDSGNGRCGQPGGAPPPRPLTWMKPKSSRKDAQGAVHAEISDQLRQMKEVGFLGSIVGMLPGGSEALRALT